MLATATGVFLLSLLIFRGLPGEFVPSQDQSRLMVRIQTAVSSNFGETDQLFQKVEAVVTAKPEVLRCFAVVGGFGGGSISGGVLFVTFAPPDERNFTQNDFAAVLRKELNAIPGVKAVVQDLSQQGFTAQRGFPIEFSLRGPDWATLENMSGDLMAKLSESGLAVDIDTDYRLGVPELRVVPDRSRCADLGVSVEEVATAINALVGGIRVGKFNSDGRRVDVRARLLAEQRTSPQDVARLRVRGKSGELIPLSALVSYEERPALQAISRRDRERAITIFANVAPGHAQDEALAFVQTLQDDVPAGYRVVLGGASMAYKDSMRSLMFALMLGILFAYMVLASQFNSYSHPITVLTILPLSVAGAAAALLIAGKSLNIFSMIGLLLLMGIVKKNSIILVDYANQNRLRGLDPDAAMMHAGPVRLRPILMTSASTMMAAVPPALGLGAGSEIRTPMAVAVIGGVFVSTLLSLLVVPSFYIKIESWIAKLRPARQPIACAPAQRAHLD